MWNFLSIFKKSNSGSERFSSKEAEDLLGTHGFQIIKKQPRVTVATKQDDKEHFGYVEADYVVAQGKDKYLALVCDGEVEDPAVRRQLLEAGYVFGRKNLLTIDLGKKEVHRVSFSFHHETSLDDIFRWLIMGFFVLALIGIIWLLLVARLV